MYVFCDICKKQLEGSQRHRAESGGLIKPETINKGRSCLQVCSIPRTGQCQQQCHLVCGLPKCLPKPSHCLERASLTALSLCRLLTVQLPSSRAPTVLRSKYTFSPRPTRRFAKRIRLTSQAAQQDQEQRPSYLSDVIAFEVTLEFLSCSYLASLVLLAELGVLHQCCSLKTPLVSEKEQQPKSQKQLDLSWLTVL